MIFLLLIVLFVSFKDCKFVQGNRLEGNFYDDYMSVAQTSAINGIFALLIFLSHSSGYLNLQNTGMINDLYLDVRYYLLQLVVVTFFFYSGYGIMTSIQKKGIEYVKKFPKERILKVLLMLDASVLIYFIVGLILGKKFTVSQFLLSLIGFKDLGNSGWYIFAILLLYVITYISFMIFKESKLAGIFLVAILTGVYIFIAIEQGIESRYWNTIIMYSLGMLYAYFRAMIDKVVMKNNIVYSFMFTISFLIFQLGYFTRGSGVVAYGVFCLGFMMMVLLFTMKVKVYNSFIFYLGKNLFPFYMMQRLPMIIFANTLSKEVNEHPYLFIVTSFVITMFIASIFVKVLDALSARKHSHK